MDTKGNKQDVQGRSWDQITKNGTSSAGSMGTGGTGDIGSMSGNTEAGSSQQDSRTDDLLASGADEQGGAEGFQNPKGKGEIQTGMAGIGNLAGNGAGNRQQDEQKAQSEARGASESGGGSENR
ncbi:hypothetical protein [Massilia brevitalea]|uniref:hypothetical protein n=1 Tax=Massilia brevitalea TaxID=442526 RepID=UPI00273868D2|nr:hypothetical protein [Massilia brevitalea]